jgi:chemotaxis protein MotB
MSLPPRKAVSRQGDDDHEEHDEELWLVSYADMMTLLFGFFVILYSFSTLDDKKFDQMSERMAEAFKNKDDKKAAESDVGLSAEARQIRALQMLVSMLNLGDSVDDAIGKIEKSFAEGKNAENAKAILVEKVVERNKSLVSTIDTAAGSEYQTIELVLPAKTLFPSGGYSLSKDAATQLQGLADDLRQVTGLSEIEIVGHTDSQTPGPGSLYDNNFTLSSLRAGAVASTLIRYGVDRKRIVVRGMGDLKPLLPEFGEDGRPNATNMAKNRRVSVLLKVRRTHAPTSH